MSEQSLKEKVLLAKAGSKRERDAMHQAIIAFGNRFTELGVDGVPAMMGELTQSLFEIADAFMPPEFQQLWIEKQSSMMVDMANLKRADPKKALVDCARESARKMLNGRELQP